MVRESCVTVTHLQPGKLRHPRAAQRRKSPAGALQAQILDVFIFSL